MLEIRRESGIEDRLDQNRDKSKQVTSHSPLANAMTLYDSPENMKLYRDHPSGDYSEIVTLQLDDGLCPEDLNQFHQLVPVPSNNLDSLVYYVFSSAMMQKVYDNGHNDFTLSGLRENSKFIGAHCKGTKENPFSLTVEGTVGNEAAFCMKYINATFHDIVGNFATYAQNCDFTVLGDIKDSVCFNGSNNIIRFANWSLYLEIKDSVVAKDNEVLYI